MFPRSSFLFYLKVRAFYAGKKIRKFPEIFAFHFSVLRDNDEKYIFVALKTRFYG